MAGASGSFLSGLKASFLSRDRFAPRLMLAACCAVLMAGFVGAAVFGGYLAGRYQFWPFEFLQHVQHKLFGTAFDDAKERHKSADWIKTTTSFQSIFVTLKVEIGAVDLARPGSGGGMTSFGNEAVLLAYDGEIFSARSAKDIVKRANIEVPDNGYEAYRRVGSEPQYKSMPHAFDLLRYNDILYFHSDKQSGLAISYTAFEEKGRAFEMSSPFCRSASRRPRSNR